MTVPEQFRRNLLVEARHRCCLHRRMWLRRVEVEHGARKYEPLDIHHVTFRSCGGSDAPENLVPICPLCHRMFHDGSRSGEEFVTDKDLRVTWDNWKHLRRVVPPALVIGPGVGTPTACVSFEVYGLTSMVGVSSGMSYGEFRQALIERTVTALRKADPYFPFLGNDESDSRWELSADGCATPGEWKIQPAVDVISALDQAISFRAPQLILLAETVGWLASTRPEHRGL